MFADDLNIFILNKQRVWEELVRTIGVFESISGLKINYNKSTVYRIGSVEKSRANAYTLKKINLVIGAS